MPNFYNLLGIDPKADRQSVKQAYLAKIKEWHPDVNPDRAEEAEEKTKTLNQAYHILRTPKSAKIMTGCFDTPVEKTSKNT
jgi:curved DNA-binding protein CbpA